MIGAVFNVALVYLFKLYLYLNSGGVVVGDQLECLLVPSISNSRTNVSGFG